MNGAMIAALVLVLTSWTAMAGEGERGFVRLAPDELEWRTPEPGLSVAILEGNPKE